MIIKLDPGTSLGKLQPIEDVAYGPLLILLLTTATRSISHHREAPSLSLSMVSPKPLCN